MAATLALVLLVSGLAQAESKVLNNLVTELVNVQEPQTAPHKSYTFTSPRKGWIFFSSTATVAGAGRVLLLVDSEDQANAIIIHRAGETETKEAMRYLPAGPHTLNVYCDNGASVGRLVVRSIPEIIYCELGYQPTRWLGVPPEYTWEYLQRIGMNKNINVICERTTAHSLDVKQWRGREGKKILTYMNIGEMSQAGKTLTVDEAYSYFATSRGFADPERDGAMFDELGPWGFEDKYAAYTEAVRRLKANPAFAGKVLYPYCVVMFNPATRLAIPFLKTLRDTENRFSEEVYLGEQPTKDMALNFIDGGVAYLRYKMRNYEAALPGAAKFMIVNVGYMSEPPESLNANPAADYKVYLDMQFNFMANDPLCKGLYGVETYHSAFADEEIQRWVVKLFRHYCIEGKKEMLSKDPYELHYIKNPDFADGTNRWTLSPAVPESMGRRNVPGYSYLQGRYPSTTQGETVLWTKRSAAAPNRCSQQIVGLTQGRLYSAKMFTSDYQEYVNRSSKQAAHQVRLQLDGGELIPDKCFDKLFPSSLAGHGYDKFDGKNSLWITYHFRVFRAQGTTAMLTISDWPDDQKPGGPIGQELMFNFIEVQPYLED